MKLASIKIQSRLLSVPLVLATLFAVSPAPAFAEDNVLSPQEKAEGWTLLFDGQSVSQWRSVKSDSFPTNIWSVHDGILTVQGLGNAESSRGGDIITRARYANFDLQVDFRTTTGCNSGIKIFAQTDLDADGKPASKPGTGAAVGLEYQILDDEHHPDAKLGRDGDRKLGALYDLIPAGPQKRANPVGEWNHARILSNGRHVEHWLNGVKILEYDRGSESFRNAVAQSKFKRMAGFGEWADGHILLQEHGSDVSFKNIKIRILPGS
jgi:hypothetical protein